MTDREVLKIARTMDIENLTNSIKSQVKESREEEEADEIFSETLAKRNSLMNNKGNR